MNLHFCTLVNEFKCISSAGLHQGAAQISAGDAQSPFVEVNPLKSMINCKDGLNIAPFQGSFSTNDPSKDVVRIFAFR